MIVADDGTPLPGATIQVKGTQVRAMTDADGRFKLEAESNAVLIVTFIGFETQEVRVGPRKNVTVSMVRSVSALDASIVQGYGVTSRRYSTSNIAKVSGKDTEMIPNTNPLAALQGRVPGLVITANNGLPGAQYKVEIRGRTQVERWGGGAGDQPLFIIDGVPMASNNENINMLQSAISANSTGGLSPFNGINTADIESIEVLKDADATSIYGSRGANGVILVTTRRAKAGGLQFNINANTGGSRAALPRMLTTKEYMAMRNEAFANDGIVKNTTNAYDMLLWDSTRDNNLTKQLIGGTASYTNIQASASGGTQQLQYRVSGGYNRQTDIFPGTFPNTRSAASFSLTSRSKDQKFTMTVNSNFSANKNTSTSSDMSMKLTLPPNYKLYDSLGNIAWNEGGIKNDNPLAYMLQRYTANSDNLTSNVNMSYSVLKNLIIRANVGYNSIKTDELRLTPRSSINPLDVSTLASAQFGNSKFASWIFEPQADYIAYIGKGKLTAMVGATFQSQNNNGYSFRAEGYTSDEFLGTLIGLPSTGLKAVNSMEARYKYQAFFGRVNYVHAEKYLLNLTARRDGSSRFGPNYRFSTFAAAGAGWIFTNEDFMKEIQVISFGKLRGSYGTTGNDKIGDYKYWTPTA
ncbi:SusC/RagA family TonB-linked outer membrane protein [Chitinophaga sedimenti]|uniref:SusC/RagA family TonB-linked outer membrane protein n=1 Tax=Chitinophaga sedimenti TaxID=2033606 RepID=UPI002004782D|nr:SusC/RagA family TonB-linked outer membrane protein [Chitinophaga sedimenti]MCK7556818.1 SusC/RagA family TonB-linked outer membrane protein [Chitinophaga sedimenti]